MIERDDLAAWLRLLETPAIGRETARRLLAAFGSPHAIFDAPPVALKELLTAEKASALRSPPPLLDALIEATWQWLAAGEQRHVVALGDPAYPRALLETADPPLLIHAIGRIALLNVPSVAVVGSRNPTPQGAENARAFATALSHAGLTVVSGLALGIDGAAHDGALAGPGSTIAVVGTGLDREIGRAHV
jgi:DNA processing protein